jgi:hypothetical protein
MPRSPSSSSANAAHAVIDRNGDYKADRVILIAQGLDQPNGPAFRNGALYVSRTPDRPYDVAVYTSAVAALFEKIAPGILLTRSQSGTLGWRTVIKSRNIRAVARQWRDAVNRHGGDVTLVELPAVCIRFKADVQFIHG